MFKFKFATVLASAIAAICLLAGSAFADSGLEQKQAEIDKTVFEEKSDEIAGMGFMVTNTGVVGEYVEIGISPYEERFADYLYSLFGEDVKVVEGIAAIPYSTWEDPASTGIASSETEPAGTVEQGNGLTFILAAAAGAAVIAVCVVIFVRRAAARR
ncbi:MAG: hypothetical protein BWY11_02181 [Firmicutes bacterium ADurb.Bin182]|nr:MAG: hypothetical protein BWY11_02181 [Firmicutes bacterium ADurb.Bin182]